MNTDDSQQLLALAAHLRRAGRMLEAITAYEQLLRSHPDLPDSWYNLAFLQRSARAFEAALESYRQALQRGVSQPEEVYVNCAVILAAELARSDEAEQMLGCALSLNPRYVPALLNLGNLHEDRGDRAQAAGAYERVLALDPLNALALARLAGLRPIGSAADPLVTRLRQALARPGIGADEQADLGFGLGMALDGAGAYDDAFAAYAAANRASRAVAAAAGRGYDRMEHKRFVDRLIRAFPRPFKGLVAERQQATPVFICGLFRSGSTLVEQMLAGHSRVTAGGELDLVPAMASGQLVPFPEAVGSLDRTRLRQLQDSYRDGLALRFPGADVVTDKRPDNFLYIGLIKTLFPNARIVHTRRNALDNCLSIFFLHLGHGMPYAVDLLDIAHWLGQYQRLMRHWRSLYGESIADVDYDALVAQPRLAVQALLNHCGLPWEDACLDFHKADAVVKTASVWQVRQPLYTRSSGRWRNYERHLDELRAALQRLPG